MRSVERSLRDIRLKKPTLFLMAVLFAGAFAFLGNASNTSARPDLKRFFDAHGVTGTFVVLDLQTGHRTVYNPSRAAARVLPASTFKVANTLIGLETRTVGPDTVFKWDGVERSRPEWNRDHDLESAFRNSVVWYYQEIARRVGVEAMQEYLDRFQYGNRRIGDAVDTFWFDGSLLISPDEQLEFLRKVYLNEFGLQPENIEILKNLMLIEQTSEYRLLGKTGLAPDRKPALGWLVGYVLKKGGAWIYAMNIEAEKPDRDFMQDRLAITRDILKELKIIGAANQ